MRHRLRGRGLDETEVVKKKILYLNYNLVISFLDAEQTTNVKSRKWILWRHHPHWSLLIQNSPHTILATGDIAFMHYWILHGPFRAVQDVYHICLVSVVLRAVLRDRRSYWRW